MLRLHSLLVVLLLLGLTACKSSTPTQSLSENNAERSRERVVGKAGGSVTYRLTAPPQSFNYLKIADEPSLIVAFYLLGGRLVEFDHDTGTYVPGVAERWQLAADGRTVDVTLREGVKFSDGQPLTAQDVAFTFRALYDERTASPAFRDAMLIGGHPIEVRVTDARRLQLVFPETVAVPESYMSNLAVLPLHVLEADFKRGTLRDAYGLGAPPQNIVTAGAYAVSAVAPGERITLRRNPHYWKKDTAGNPLPYLDQLVLEVVSDANNALARVQQGEVDLIDRIRPTDYAALRLQTGNARAVDAGPGLSTDHLWFNLTPQADAAKRPWFNEVRFRRAVSQAIDRKSIAKITLQGLATPLFGFVSPGNRAWVASDLPQADFDLEKARALLIEAGFALRGTPQTPELFDASGNRVEFTLLAPAESQPRMMTAAVIQEDLAKLGIKMQVAPLEFGELRRRIEQSFAYDAALLGASVTEPDPSSYSNFLRSSSPSHQWHPNQATPATPWEARIDELLNQQARATKPEQRRALFREVQAILAEQLPVIPIVARHLASAANARVGNHRPSTILPYSLWNAEELFIR